MNGNASDPSPNYINPPTRAPATLVVSISLTLVAMVFVASRVYVKIKLKKLGTDDFLIVVSMIIAIAATVCLCVATKYGIGRHMLDVRPEWSPTSAKLIYTFVPLYNLSLLFTKTSILTFYRRLAPHQRFRRTCYVFIVYNVCASIVIFSLNAFGCAPVRGGWDRSANARCVNKWLVYITSGINNLLTDLVLLILPVPIIMKLNLAFRIKIGLMLVFSMGFLVTAVTTVRLYMVNIVMTSHDYPWDAAFGTMWSVIEFNVAIMTACMPGIKLFVIWLVPGIIRSNDRRSDSPGVEGGRTIGSGGGRIQLRPLDETSISHANDSEEYIMNGLDAGGDKSIEIDLTPGSRGGSDRVSGS